MNDSTLERNDWADRDGDSDQAMEMSGYLAKKSTKGLYNHRFFVTGVVFSFRDKPNNAILLFSSEGKYLMYWTDKSNYDSGGEPSERYDLCEMKYETTTRR